MKEKYTAELIVGQAYDFKVHQDDKTVCKNGILVAISLKRGWGELIWNGQLYDIPLSLIRTKWERKKNIINGE